MNEDFPKTVIGERYGYIWQGCDAWKPTNEFNITCHKLFFWSYIIPINEVSEALSNVERFQKNMITQSTITKIAVMSLMTNKLIHMKT